MTCTKDSKTGMTNGLLKLMMTKNINITVSQNSTRQENIVTNIGHSRIAQAWDYPWIAVFCLTQPVVEVNVWTKFAKISATFHR